jgi:leader peptidase (prepilin peptidase)/N-methyltransferase
MTSALVTAIAKVAEAGNTDLTATIVTRGAVTAFAAVTGLVVGSFLNVVVYRVPRGLSVVKPPSFCPHCDTRVRPVDNVPVLSWIVLGGKCHACRGRISIRYPLVELATGLVFAAVGWGLGPHWAVPGFCVLAATLVALVAVEADGLAPPLSVAVIGTAIAVALLTAAGVADRRWAHVIGLVIAVLAAAAVIEAVRRGRPIGEDSWTGSLPVLLPVAAGVGWLGPAYVAEGLASTVVALLAIRAFNGQRGRGGQGAWLGVALATGAVVATVVAVAVGAGAGT